MRTNRPAAGFTLVEILIIAPVVVLFIGAFIGLVVSLTSDSLRLREKNAAAYNVQEALNDVEANVALATSFQVATGTLQSPQGKNNGTAQFTNTTSGQPDTLILKSAATDKSPYDPTRVLIHTGTSPCNARNVVYQYFTIYFVSNGALYKRTVLPQQAACAMPWQRGTCAETHVAANPSVCKTEDTKLLEGVAAIDVQYYSGAADDTPIADSQATDANGISINITLNKSIAGETVEYTGGSRITSMNAQASDSVAEAPEAPSLTWTNSTATPYTTTFQWSPMGNATGYNVRYRIDGGAWVNGPQGTTATSYNVVATHRKQVVEAEVTALTSAGNFLYGTASRTIPRWQDCSLSNGWTEYGGSYVTGGFTRTSSHVVSLRGLIKNGYIGSDTTQPACILPAGFRPDQRLIFQQAGYVNGSSSARVDVLPTGEVVVVNGQPDWVSLSGIVFVSSNAPYTMNAGTWVNGWTDYGAGYTNLKYTTDSEGRVHIQAMGRAGTLTSGTVMTNVLTGSTSLQPSNMMHMVSRSGNGGNAVSFNANGTIAARGSSATWNAFNFPYYPSTFNAWKNINMTNGWVRHSTTHTPPQCYKGSDDLVIVRGLVNSGSNGTSSGNLNSIGCGIHADGRQIFPGWMAGNTEARVDLLNTGELNFQLSSSTWTSMDNVVFVAD